MKKTVPIGYSDFKELRERDLYYVDKSALIGKIVRTGAKVTLLPRPRRFGKTLNLSMLRTFFERSEDDCAHLFKDLAVAGDAEIMGHLGRYPVIFLSFKDAKSTSFDAFLKHVGKLMNGLFFERATQFQGLAFSVADRQDFDDLSANQADQNTLASSLKLLIELTARAADHNVILLIDEYDVPIQGAYQHGYYDVMIEFMRNFLSGALKDSVHLEKGVLTGILRVAKESIFSGVNNLAVETILDERYATDFGFTEAEVDTLLKDQVLVDHRDDVRSWYNGYLFGDQLMYNPWSVLNFVQKPAFGPKAFWINTASNELIRDLVVKHNAIGRQELSALLQGEAVSKDLDESVNLRDLHEPSSAVWSLLTFTGYLKPLSAKPVDGWRRFDLEVPNREVMLFFREVLDAWVRDGAFGDGLDELFEHLLDEQWRDFETALQTLVIDSLSFHDLGQVSEAVYHAFFLGVLSRMRDRFYVKSNRESGLGRYDVSLIPHDVTQAGFVFEFKKARESSLEEAAQEALVQIRQKPYDAELKERGLVRVIAVAVAVDGKQLLVRGSEV